MTQSPPGPRSRNLAAYGAAEDMHEMAQAGVADFERDLDRKLFLSDSRILRILSRVINLEGVT